jgi:hypothetical protein
MKTESLVSVNDPNYTKSTEKNRQIKLCLERRGGQEAPNPNLFSTKIYGFWLDSEALPSSWAGFSWTYVFESSPDHEIKMKARAIPP